MPRTRHHAKPLVVAAVAVATLLASGGAPATSSASGRQDWLSLSRGLAAPWPRLQRANGTFPDHLRPDGASRYGDAMLGLALLQTGARDRRRPLVLRALRALDATARTRDPWFPTRVFEKWAVASAYNLAKSRLRHLRPVRISMHRWAPWLAHTSLDYIGRDSYENKHLVDAVTVLELQRTGLRSGLDASVIGDARGYARRRVTRLVNQAIPAMARGRSGFVLSDPPSNPIAYHGFSFALYARAVELLGRDASPQARAVLAKLASTSTLLTAPDGSVAYWGRSQEQKWSLSATAYGLAVAARQRGYGSRLDRPRYAVADRALNRLRNVGVGPHGEWLVPSIREDFARGVKSVDDYARATEYTGLALVFLNWAIPILPRGSTAGEIPADRPMRAVLGQDNGRFATVSRGGLWYAVRLRPGSFRYDFGPVAVKRIVAGVWRDVIPLRPLANGTAGPVLLGAGESSRATGEQVHIDEAGNVFLTGGFAAPAGWTRRRVQFRVRPVECGITVESPAIAGDRMEFSAFFRGEVKPQIDGQRALSGGQEVSFNVPIQSMKLERDYVSVSDAHLTRARFVVTAPAAQDLVMKLC